MSVLCGLAWLNLWAQSDFKPLASPESFKQKLKDASVSLSTIESDFMQTKYMDLLSEKIVSKGKFYYKKTDKICLHYRQPVDYLIVLNGKKVKIAADGKTNVFDLGKNKMMGQMNVLISACMTGQLNELSGEYRLEFFENDRLYHIVLSPQGSAKSYISRIDIYLGKQDFAVQRLRLTESSADYTEYVFSNTRQNTEISDEKFSIR